MSSPAAPASRIVALNKRHDAVLLSLLLLFAGAFAIRVWGLSYFHFWDEWAYLQDAKVICCGKTNYSELSFRPPLLSLLFAGAFLVRDHVFSACIAAAAANALGPVLLFVSGRRIVGWLPAAIAAFLLAFGPFFVGVFPPRFDSDDTGNSLLTDSPALTLLLLGLWLMLRALERQKTWRFSMAGLGLALAVLMRFGSIPSAAFLCLIPLAAKRRWRSLAVTALGFSAGLAPYLLWSRMTYGGFFETLREGWSHVEGPAPPFTFYLANASTIFTWIGVAGLLLAASAGLVATLKAFRRNTVHLAEIASASSPAGLQGFLWLWLIVGFIFFSQMPHKEPRYIMPLAPPLLLLAGSGLALVRRLPGRRLRAVGMFLLAAGMLVTVLPSRTRFSGPLVVAAHPEEMEASSFLASRFPPDTPLYMNFNYPAFAYFTNFRIRELPIGGEEVYQAIAKIPDGGLLVAYRENESGDPKIATLNCDPNLQAIREYGTLVLYRRLHTRSEALPLKPATLTGQ